MDLNTLYRTVIISFKYGHPFAGLSTPYINNEKQETVFTITRKILSNQK